MGFKTFDRGKMALFAMVLFTCFLSTESEYQCQYLEPMGNGWYSIKALSCDFGCCGDLLEQRCCKREEVDQKHWIIGISVVGGLLAVSIIVIIILCILKKKNLERAKIYTGNSPPAPTMPMRNTASGFFELNQTASFPLPHYTPSRYDIFVVGNGQDRSQGDANKDDRNVMSMNNVNTSYTGQACGIPSQPPAYSYVRRDDA